MNGSKIKKNRLIFVSLLILPILLLIISLYIGSYHISAGDLGKTLLSAVTPSSYPDIPQALKDIVFRIRLPRILLALAVGASLSVSGASLQALFKNPLVNEYILGISFGAAFGAALSLVFLGKDFPIQVMAFIFAIGAVAAVLFIARGIESQIVSLLLTGIIVSAFFSALLSLVQFFASPYSLQALFGWLMGNLSLAAWKDLAIAVPLMALGIAVLILLRWRMNVLSLSDEEARALGVNIRREKMLVIVSSTLATAAATSVAGIIGWVGLIVPHLVRMIIGVDNRKVIPLSAAFGASFLIVADDITRVVAPFEIPLGVFTSIIGIPLFIFLFKKSKEIWL
jgi:iron complex transport system permease protein